MNQGDVSLFIPAQIRPRGHLGWNDLFVIFLKSLK